MGTVKSGKRELGASEVDLGNVVVHVYRYAGAPWRIYVYADGRRVASVALRDDSPAQVAHKLSAAHRRLARVLGPRQADYAVKAALWQLYGDERVANAVLSKIREGGRGYAV